MFIKILKFSAIVALALAVCAPAAAQTPAWMNPAWQERTEIQIVNSGPQALSNYQVRIKLGSGFHFSAGKPDGSDLRVTASDGTTLVPFWIESWSPLSAPDAEGSLASVVAKVPSLAAGTTTKLYFYLGNATAASVSDASSVFDVYDGFESWTTGSPLTNAASPLITPTFDGGGQTVHPDIFYNASAWKGWEHWMVFEPYPFSNESVEMPSILVSHDGNIWTEPSGIVNPIANTGTGFLADAEFLYDDASGQLWTYFVQQKAGNGTTYLVRRKSSDGVHWGSQQQVNLSTETLFTVPDFQWLSPAVVKARGKYWMWATNTGPLGCYSASNTMEYRVSLDGAVWSAPSTVNFNQPGFTPWHLDVIYVPSKDEFWALVAAIPFGANCGQSSLFFAKSTDGINWTTYPNPVLAPGSGWDSSQIYRATMVYDAATDKLRVWYSGNKPPEEWHIGYTERNYTAMLATLSSSALSWKVESGSGSWSQSSTQVKRGSSSARLVQASGTDMLVSRLNSSSSFYQEWDMYDDLDSTSDKEVRVRQGNNQIGMGVYTGSDGFPNFYTYFDKTWTYFNTQVARTVGWHKFAIRIEPNGTATYYVDNQLAGTRSGQLSGANSITIGGWDDKKGTSLTTFYADDMRVRRYASPEPVASIGPLTLQNSPPVANPDSYATTVSTVLNVSAAAGVLANDSDPDGNTLTASKVTNPAHGSVTLNSNGSFTYTPVTGYSGPDSFTYKASDGTLQSAAATVSITVQVPNSAPVATADSYSTPTSTALTVAAPGVLSNDSDPDGNPITAVKVANPAHGTVTLNSDGSFTYTPTTGYSGADSFTYKASDGTLQSATTTVSLTVIANRAPVASADSYSTTTSTALSVAAPGVLSNDSDPDGNPLTAVKVANPAHGTVTLNSNGSFTYTPTTGYSGADSFTYKASDGTLQSATTTVSLTVIANGAPVANADSYFTPANTALTVTAPGVLSNDSDPDGNPITAVKVSDPAHGTVTLNANGSFTYTPTTGYSGPDSFTYKAADASLQSAAATVTITVQAPNGAPVANADSYSTSANTALTITAPGVLSNDSDPDGNPITAVKVTDPAHGTVTLNANGSFTYTPATGYSGPDSFTYKAADASLQSAAATVTITVQAPNGAPVANADSYSTPANTALTVPAPGVLSNDSDPDGNPITAVKVSDPAHGTVTLNANGSFTYTPTSGYGGPDSFTYKASDGTLQSAAATVSITVQIPNRAPVANGDSYVATSGAALIVNAPGVLVNDTDPDGNSLTVVKLTDPAHGTVTLNANGSFTYTSVAGYGGADSFTYLASDGTLQSPAATVNITVQIPNRAPLANGDAYTALSGTTLNVPAAGVLINDSDPDGDSITAIKVTDPVHGTLSLNANGSFTYTPAAGYTGPDTFTYKTSDGTLQSPAATVTLSVQASGPLPGMTVTVSSEAADTEQFGIKAVDGVIDGYPGDYTKEWATTGQTSGAWIQLNWANPVTISQVILHDRPNTTDNITASTLLFSDGSTVSAGSLPTNGAGKTINFTARTSTFLRFRVDSAAGKNTGLAELEVTAVPASGAFVSSVTLSPSTVEGGASSQGTVTLSAPAPSGGASVSLSSSSSAATVPANVLVPQNATSATFTVNTNPVAISTSSTITATYGNVSQTAILTVQAPAGVSSLVLTPSTVTGGAPVQGTVNLTGAAPTGGAVVTLSSSDPVAVVPGSVTVAAGATSANFSIATSAPLNFKTATISGSYSSTSASAVLNVYPANLTNMALSAFASASSEEPENGQIASKAIDGVVDGYPGDFTKEWATTGEKAGAWLRLDWSYVTLSDVTLYDRPNTTDNVLAGNLVFSDGSTIAVGTLPNNGTGMKITFPPKNVSWLRFDVTDAVGSNIGLAEIQATGQCAVTPSVRVANPQLLYLQASSSLTVDAATCLGASQQNWGVRFSLDGGTFAGGSQMDVMAPPYRATFTNVLKGEHTVTVDLLDSTGVVVTGAGAHDQVSKIAVGNYFVAFGDSITHGYLDNDPSDDTSADGRVTGGGYEPVLNNQLTTYRGTPHLVADEGLGGEKASDGLGRVQSMLHRNPRAETVLLQYGTNDALFSVPSGRGLVPGNSGYAGSFKDNMQQIIAAIRAAGKTVALAKVPVTMTCAPTCQANQNSATNLLIKQYNLVVDELIANQLNAITIAAPDFYTYFSAHPSEFTDSLHPNGTGYKSMAALWFTAITNGASPPGNSPPVANADTYTTPAGVALSVPLPGVLANDTDADGNALTAQKVTDPAHGTLVLSANGSFTYTPAAGYSGADSFTYQASDGTAASAAASVSLSVLPGNTAPVSNADSYNTNAGTTLSVSAPGVLVNDTDADGNTLTAQKVADPAHGTLTLNADGSFTYVPAAGYSGTDSFTYKAFDGTLTSATAATVNLTITNNAPVAIADSYTTKAGVTLNVAVPGILANDTDADGNTLTAQKVTNPAHGTLTLNADGSFTYVPTAGYVGADSFTYKAFDGIASSATAATVTFSITNAAPVAIADSYTATAGTSLNISAPGILANDTDADGNLLTAQKVTDPAHGTVSLNANGSFTYTPVAGYTGSDSFTYRAFDGNITSVTATVTITVQGGAFSAGLGTFRRALTISNSGTQLTDVQVAVGLTSTFDFASAKSDGSDIRITTADGQTQIPFWVERWTPSTADAQGNRAVIYVRMPAIPAGGGTAFLYYGNSSALSVSNAATTFDLYDNFETANLPNWTVDQGSGSWARSTTQFKRGSASALLTQTSTTSMIVSRSRTSSSFYQEWDMYDDMDTSAAKFVKVRSGSNRIGMGVRTATSSNRYVYHGKNNSYVTTTIARSSGWHKFGIRLDSNSSATLYIDGQSVGTLTNQFASADRISIEGDRASTTSYHVDDMRIRKYVSPEPAVAVGARLTQ